NERLVAPHRSLPRAIHAAKHDSEEVGGAAMDVDMDVAEMGLDAGDPHPLEKLADSDFFNKFEDDFEDEDLA
ncbi:unnamed protein product, partial [Closterium sp. Naga37s-1]